IRWSGHVRGALARAPMGLAQNRRVKGVHVFGADDIAGPATANSNLFWRHWVGWFWRARLLKVGHSSRVPRPPRGLAVKTRAILALDRLQLRTSAVGYSARAGEAADPVRRPLRQRGVDLFRFVM